MARVSAGPSVLLAASLLGLATACWWWQGHIVRAERLEVKAQPWDHVKAEYPMLGEPSIPAQLSKEIVEAVVRANPFSPKRREVPPPAAGGAGGTGSVPKAPPPIFTYKGRINLGKRQRAIVEDTVSGKTYFLEVGQEVAGFKVLDIAENRVVLSDLATHEEVVVSLSSKDER